MLKLSSAFLVIRDIRNIFSSSQDYTIFVHILEFRSLLDVGSIKARRYFLITKEGVSVGLGIQNFAANFVL